MRRALSVAVLFASFLAAPPAHATDIVGTFYPGVTIPLGDFAADSLGGAKTGFQFGIALDAMLTKNLSAGVEFDWGVNNNVLEGKKIDQGGGFYTRYNQNQYEIRQYGVRGRYFLTTGSHFHPFALVGVGGYDVNGKYEVAFGGPVPTAEVKQKGETDFGTRFGWRGGLGFEYEASPQVLLGLGAEYNNVSMDKAKYGSSSAAFWGIRASIGHNFSK